MKKRNDIFYKIFLIMIIPVLLGSANMKFKNDEVKKLFDVKFKVLNGITLAQAFKEVEPSNELEKYLLISIVNNSGKTAYLTLRVRSKLNPEIKLDIPINLLPPSNVMRMPIYFLQWLGGIDLTTPDDQVEITYEIKNLDFY